ncbi:MAG: hypothetical protein HZA54_02170 [Planctomycetes bacterium]|nr:hypothetical protein [Planctomycetota bacterium]
MNRIVWTETAVALHLARKLALMWRVHRSQHFAERMARTYRLSVDALPRFDGIYIAQAEYGDAARGEIGSVLRRLWVVDDAGLRPAADGPRDFATRGLFYVAPVLKFFGEGDLVTLGERWGPDIGGRWIGRVAVCVDRLHFIGLRTSWTRSPADRPQRP